MIKSSAIETTIGGGIEFKKRPTAGGSETAYYASVSSHTNFNNWASYTIVVNGDGTVKYYIDGVEKALSWVNETTLSFVMPTLIQNIKGFDLAIGNRPSFDDAQLDGWVRNVQIVSSTSLSKVTLANTNTTVYDWTKTLFTNSVNISSQPLTVSGSDVILVPNHFKW